MVAIQDQKAPPRHGHPQVVDSVLKGAFGGAFRSKK